MEKYCVGLVRYLTAKLQDRNQAADVAHDAYIRVLETRGHMSLEFPQAFLLRKLDGLGHDEIAAQMGISKAMVEKHIVKAMKFCRVRVKEMERLD